MLKTADVAVCDSFSIADISSSVLTVPKSLTYLLFHFVEKQGTGITQEILKLDSKLI